MTTTTNTEIVKVGPFTAYVSCDAEGCMVEALRCETGHGLAPATVEVAAAALATALEAATRRLSARRAS